jgi:CO/xanthine dehydrogenase FAD-binding subunit
VTVLLPRSLDEVCAELAARPDAQLLAGGTDLMVGVNAGRHPLHTVIALDRVDELRGWRRVGDHLEIGSGVTHAQLASPELAGLVPVLGQAARTVGSPQIRNAGTLGGNLATASPAGDLLPGLAALGAVVRIASLDGERAVPFGAFCVGPKRTSLEAGELIVGVRVPVLDGPQEFLKVGTRNAMVIAVAAVAVVADRGDRIVGVGLGSVGPTTLRAPEAEAWAAQHLRWDAPDGRLAIDDPTSLDRFGALVSAAARPIDDHRSTAQYRRHCVGVLARRALRRMTAAPNSTGST